MRITLRNSFHNTSTTINVPAEDLDTDPRVSPATTYMHQMEMSDNPADRRRVARVKARLCGVKGCTCSGSWGT